MSVEILPYVGIKMNGKEINFGMRQVEIEAILGVASEIVINNIMKNKTETRSGMKFIYRGEELTDIVVSKHVKLKYKEIDIFNTENVIELLSNYSKFEKSKYADNAYGNFYDLGLSFGGFGSVEIPEGRIVIIFSKELTKWYEGYLVV